MTTAWLLWGVLFGSFGAGYLLYGKKQKAVVPLVCGLVLIGLPWFVTNTLLLVLFGAALIAAPWFIKL